MAFLTVNQIKDVLMRLPPPCCVDGEYYRVAVREDISEKINFDETCQCRFFEFLKSPDGNEWVLGSVPPF